MSQPQPLRSDQELVLLRQGTAEDILIAATEPLDRNATPEQLITTDPEAGKIELVDDGGTAIETLLFPEAGSGAVQRLGLGTYKYGFDSALLQSPTYLAFYRFRTGNAREIRKQHLIRVAPIKYFKYIPILRLMVDKSRKSLTSTNITSRGGVTYGYSDAMMSVYLDLGAGVINMVPPYTGFGVGNFPDQHLWVLIQAATLVALESQGIYAVDTDYVYSLGGNALTIDHLSKIAQVSGLPLFADFKDWLIRFKQQFRSQGSVLVQMQYSFSISTEEELLIREGKRTYPVTIGEACANPREGSEVLAIHPASGEVGWHPVTQWWEHDTSAKDCYKIKTAGGKSITITGDHSLFEVQGNRLEPVQGRALKEGSEIVTCDLRHRLETSTSRIDRVKAVEPVHVAKMYDLSVPGVENFVASGVMAHNSIGRFFSVGAEHELIVRDGGKIQTVPIGDFAAEVKSPEVLAVDTKTGRPAWKKVQAWLSHDCAGKDCYRVRLSSRTSISLTGDHSVFRFGLNSLLRVKGRDLQVGDEIVVAPPRAQGHLLDTEVCRAKIVSIEPMKSPRMYDISVPGSRFENFVADGIMCCNSSVPSGFFSRYGLSVGGPSGVLAGSGFTP